eukprot:bmy_07718T0
MINTKGKRRGTRYMFSRPFRKHEVAPLATCMRIYKKGDIVDIKGMGTVQKGMPHKCYHGKTGRVYNVTQHAVGIIVNKQVKGKILAKRINVHIEHIKHAKSRDSFLKQVKENGQKKKEAKEKVFPKNTAAGAGGNEAIKDGRQTEGKQRKDSEPAIVMIRHIQRGLCCDTVHSPLLTGEEAQQMHWDDEKSRVPQSRCFLYRGCWLYITKLCRELYWRSHSSFRSNHSALNDLLNVVLTSQYEDHRERERKSPTLVSEEDVFLASTMTLKQEEVTFHPWLQLPSCPNVEGKQLSRQLDGKVLPVLPEQLLVVVVHRPLLGQVLGLHGVQEVLPPAALQLHEGAQPALGVALNHLQPAGSLLKHLLRDRVCAIKLSERLQQLLLAVRGQALCVEQGPGPRTHLPALRIFQQAQALLGASGGLELPGQLLLQVVVIVVGDGVAGGAEQQHVVGVVVLHLDGKVLPVLMRNHVLPKQAHAEGNAR